MPVCKAMLELGPEWLDSFVRQVLYEAYANGLEAGFVSGDGNGKPIGMNRQVGDNVTVTGGVYPEKIRHCRERPVARNHRKSAGADGSRPPTAKRATSET